MPDAGMHFYMHVCDTNTGILQYSVVLITVSQDVHVISIARSKLHIMFIYNN